MDLTIDVHGHLFSARDIPIKGYLLSRKRESILEKIFGPIVIPLIARCIRKKVDRYRSQSFISKLLCKIAMLMVIRLMGKEYRKWAETLSKELPDIAKEMVSTYPEDQINLFIPLMIDYEYWFKNSIDNHIIRQIENMYNKVVLPYEGRIHPFVPFDPARELAHREGIDNPDGCPELISSLELVKDAIENKGFIGVKLYNSLGYKPYNNKDVEKKRKQICLHDTKYNFSGDRYDEVLAELYEYCVENEVPITAHCVMDGIEAYPRASFDFGEAVFWRDVLNIDRFKKLHLNLAHFGWHETKDFGEKDSWVEEICEMLNDYENLFTDVSHHRVISSKGSKKFKSEYKKIISKYPIVKERLLFGIDWHVIKRLKDYSDFKQKYIKVLTHDNLFNDKEKENFLYGNALRFLGLLPGGKNRDRLDRFYKSNNINPPNWFNATSTTTSAQPAGVP